MISISITVLATSKGQSVRKIRWTVVKFAVAYLHIADFDTLTLSSDFTIEGQSIGVASKIEGFGNIDGILGLGPVDLTQRTVAGEDVVPTVADNLLAQHKISSEVFSLSFEPSTSSTAPSGELIFGGTNPSKYTGSITYTPITNVEPSSALLGINQAVQYGVSEIELLKSTAGIVDSGTTLVLLAPPRLTLSNADWREHR